MLIYWFIVHSLLQGNFHKNKTYFRNVYPHPHPRSPRYFTEDTVQVPASTYYSSMPSFNVHKSLLWLRPRLGILESEPIMSSFICLAISSLSLSLFLLLSINISICLSNYLCLSYSLPISFFLTTYQFLPIYLSTYV